MDMEPFKNFLGEVLNLLSEGPIGWEDGRLVEILQNVGDDLKEKSKELYGLKGIIIHCPSVMKYNGMLCLATYYYKKMLASMNSSSESDGFEKGDHEDSRFSISSDIEDEEEEEVMRRFSKGDDSFRTQISELSSIGHSSISTVKENFDSFSENYPKVPCNTPQTSSSSPISSNKEAAHFLFNEDLGCSNFTPELLNGVFFLDDGCSKKFSSPNLNCEQNCTKFCESLDVKRRSKSFECLENIEDTKIFESVEHAFEFGSPVDTNILNDLLDVNWKPENRNRLTKIENKFTFSDQLELGRRLNTDTNSDMKTTCQADGRVLTFLNDMVEDCFSEAMQTLSSLNRSIYATKSELNEPTLAKVDLVERKRGFETNIDSDKTFILSSQVEIDDVTKEHNGYRTDIDLTRELNHEKSTNSFKPSPIVSNIELIECDVVSANPQDATCVVNDLQFFERCVDSTDRIYQEMEHMKNIESSEQMSSLDRNVTSIKGTREESVEEFDFDDSVDQVESIDEDFESFEKADAIVLDRIDEVDEIDSFDQLEGDDVYEYDNVPYEYCMDFKTPVNDLSKLTFDDFYHEFYPDEDKLDDGQLKKFEENESRSNSSKEIDDNFFNSLTESESESGENSSFVDEDPTISEYEKDRLKVSTFHDGNGIHSASPFSTNIYSEEAFSSFFRDVITAKCSTLLKKKGSKRKNKISEDSNKMDAPLSQLTSKRRSFSLEIMEEGRKNEVDRGCVSMPAKENVPISVLNSSIVPCEISFESSASSISEDLKSSKSFERKVSSHNEARKAASVRSKNQLPFKENSTPTLVERSTKQTEDYIDDLFSPVSDYSYKPLPPFVPYNPEQDECVVPDKGDHAEINPDIHFDYDYQLDEVTTDQEWKKVERRRSKSAEKSVLEPPENYRSGNIKDECEAILIGIPPLATKRILKDAMRMFGNLSKLKFIDDYPKCGSRLAQVRYQNASECQFALEAGVVDVLGKEVQMMDMRQFQSKKITLYRASEAREILSRRFSEEIKDEIAHSPAEAFSLNSTFSTKVSPYHPPKGTPMPNKMKTSIMKAAVALRNPGGASRHRNRSKPFLQRMNRVFPSIPEAELIQSITDVLQDIDIPQSGMSNKLLAQKIFNDRLRKTACMEDDSCLLCCNLYGICLTITLSCFHSFHNMCLDGWMNIIETCPICEGMITKMKE